MIRIRTVGREQFREDCGRLWDSVASGCSPDLVVGIRSGGWWVAKEMKAARANTGAIFLPLTCRRPGTATKERSRLFRWLVKVLPYFVLNTLRRVEYYCVTLPRCRSARDDGLRRLPVIEPAELAAIGSAVQELGRAPCVVVVDDSLDSGATLWNVMTTLRELVPEARIMTAAFTVLGPAPIIAADFSLYQRINCRFPWSFDFHG